jgi:hypothetical protein
METEKKVEPKKHQIPRFIHFGWYGQTMGKGKHKHNGVLTVAYRQTDAALRVGFIFCSRSDNFSRKEGRNEALRIMRNYPIVMPLRPDKFNRDLILELVNYLCGIGPKGKTWDIPNETIYNRKTHIEGGTVFTPRIPGWAKRWWINIAVNGSPMGKHQTPKRTKLTPNAIGFTYNIFENMPMSEFLRQARAVGLDIALI